ncbi:MAG: DHA2 family efflux MFS transporter permease subunit [Minwuia sp.]|uniref:DHA2 family efflux MFS transporter permease subunit n=1 Tax=Minwuia sp. TaxID=2493630 RepID=UPI003A89D1EB
MADSVEVLFRRYGPGYRWLALVAAMIATMSAVLSATIVNVAIPDIMGAFGIDQITAQWLSSGFLAAMTATMLLIDWATKTIGQRATMNIALGLFLAGGLLGGLAENSDAVILSRLMQGASAGVIQPLAMIVVFQVFPPERRGFAMGIYGLGVVMAPGTSPFLGGLLVDGFGWRYTFYIAVPMGVLGLILSQLFVPSGALSRERPRFDWFGYGMLLIFLVSLMTAFADGQELGWSSLSVTGRFLIAASAFALFIFWERRCPAPLMDLTVFLKPGFPGAVVVSIILGAGLFGSTYLIPLFAQTVQNLTPTLSGLLLLPAGLSMMFITTFSGRMADRFEPGMVVGFGLVMFAVSFFLMSFADPDTAFITLAFYILISRAGMGFIFPSLSAGSVRLLPMTHLAQGSSIMNFTRQLGGAFGVNILAVLLDRQITNNTDHVAATQTAANHTSEAYVRIIAEMAERGGLTDIQAEAVAYSHLAKALQTEAASFGFQTSFFYGSIAFLVSVVGAVMMVRGARKRKRLEAMA